MKKKLLFLFLLISTVCSAQYQLTSSKFRYYNGIAFSARDTTGWASIDSNVLVMGRDSSLYVRNKGYWRKVGTSTDLATKLNISDTAAMLSTYQRILANYSTTYALSNDVRDSIQTKLAFRDTATMLSGYKTYYPRTAISSNSATGVLYNNSTGNISVDTTIIATRLRVQKGIDSVSALIPNVSGYKLISDTLFNNGYTTRNTTKKIADSLGVVASSGLATKLNLSDTLAMLSPYQRSYSAMKYTDTAAALNSYKLSIIALNADTATLEARFINQTNLVNTEKSRAEYVESTKANSSDVFQTIVIDYSSSGWNGSKTQYTFSSNLPNYNIFNNSIGRYLLSTEVTKTLTSFTLADTARTGDVFFVTGALGAPSTITSNANASQVRIDKIRAKLQGKSTLGIGLISLSEISVTQNNPYNLLFWYDGAIVWPLKKVDSVFNTLWKEGGILYIDSIGGKWESISVARMNDPSLASTVRTYYVQYSTGVDDTTRGSYATPFKRLSYAHSRAVTVAQRDLLPYEVRILDEWVGTDGGFTGSPTLPDGVKGKYTGYNSSGKKTRLVGMRESYTDALFNWQYVGFGTWASYSSSINTATKQSLAQFDLLYRDADSAPMPLYYVAPLADSATTITAIQNRPASFGYYGTGSMYVHTFDGRKPSVDNWVYDEGISNALDFQIGEGSNCFLENIERYYTVAGVASAAIRARPINVPFSYLSHTGQFWLYNCGAYGASGQGFQIYDMQYGGTEWLVCKYNREDAENYHSFNTNAYTPNTMGNFMNLWSNFSISEHLGETNFKGQLAVGNSVNAISAHDKINLISLNSFGGYTHGSVSAHVIGAQVLQMNCHYYFPTQLPFIGPPSSGSPKTPFWADSDGFSPVTKLTLIGCSGNTFRNTNIFSSTNNAVLNYYLQAGKTTSEIYNGGTINNLNY